MGKVTRKRRAGKEIRLLDGEEVDVAVDTHKRSYKVGLWSFERGVMATWSQPADPGALARRLEPHAERIRRVVYEAGPTGYALVRELRRRGFTAEVVATSEIPRPPTPRAKSDRLDCAKLAEYSAKGLLRPVTVPTREEEADRQVVRLRAGMRKKVKVWKQQIKSFLLQHGIREPEGLRHWALRGVCALRDLELPDQLRFALDVLLDGLEQGEDRLARVMEKVEELSRTGRHRRAHTAMRSVPGVGLVTAMTFRTEMYSAERFEKGSEVASMSGLAPLVRSSGETRREGPIMKSGKPGLRAVLVEAAWRWVAGDPWARSVYGRLVSNTGCAQKAIVGMARRLAIILWRLMTRGGVYRPGA